VCPNFSPKKAVLQNYLTWKFLYCIDRFDHIKSNKSNLINNIF
jgi:hypothetical protein